MNTLTIYMPPQTCPCMYTLHSPINFVLNVDHRYLLNNSFTFRGFECSKQAAEIQKKLIYQCSAKKLISLSVCSVCKTSGL